MSGKIIITDNIAYVIYQYHKNSSKFPCKKTLQKMLYLVQAEGVDLGFEYGIHFYGPYSADLDEEVISLVADGIVRFKYVRMSHFMEIDDSLYTVKSNLDKSQEEKLRAIIARYKDKSPSELELITTTHYVKENLSQKDVKSVIQGVKKIKGNKYSTQEIENEYYNL